MAKLPTADAMGFNQCFPRIQRLRRFLSFGQSTSLGFAVLGMGLTLAGVRQWQLAKKRGTQGQDVTF
jgi:hypothetical protein